MDIHKRQTLPASILLDWKKMQELDEILHKNKKRHDTTNDLVKQSGRPKVLGEFALE